MQVAIVTVQPAALDWAARRNLPRWGWRSSAPAATRTNWPSWKSHRQPGAGRDPGRRPDRDDAPRRIVDLAVDRWGHIDFLINNAGVRRLQPLHETDDETLDYFLGLMLRAPFRLARDVLPHMSPGSAIINITSTFAVVGGCAAAPILRPKVG